MRSGAKRVGRHHRRALPSQAGDAVDTRGLNGLRHGNYREDGSEPVRPLNAGWVVKPPAPLRYHGNRRGLKSAST
jgi:hypothetical protein